MRASPPATRRRYVAPCRTRIVSSFACAYLARVSGSPLCQAGYPFHAHDHPDKENNWEPRLKQGDHGTYYGNGGMPEPVNMMGRAQMVDSGAELPKGAIPLFESGPSHYQSLVAGEVPRSVTNPGPAPRRLI